MLPPFSAGSFFQLVTIALEFFIIGINGKMSELHAAMGICVLNRIEYILKERQKISETYNISLSPRLKRLKIRLKTKYNYSYFPVIFEDEKKFVYKMCYR